MEWVAIGECEAKPHLVTAVLLVQLAREVQAGRAQLLGVAQQAAHVLQRAVLVGAQGQLIAAGTDSLLQPDCLQSRMRI